MLVDAETDEDIGPISSGEVFLLSELHGSLNIRANATSDVESVLLQLTGSLTNLRIENVAPYALFGDRNSDYNGETFGPGDYTIAATPYTENRLSGTMGTMLSVDFSVIVPPGVPLPNSMSLYPNPASEMVSMEFEQATELIAFKVFDMAGRLVKQVEAVERNGEYEMPVFGLPAGNYIIRTMDRQGNAFAEQMVIER